MSEHVHLCCNHPENGHFAGRLFGVEYRGLDLKHDDCFRGCSIAFLNDGRVRISRRTFRYQGMREWVGNWCWNAISMDSDEAERLARYLHSTGKWCCEGGPTEMCEWWDAQGGGE